ncbi:MAG TPA: mycothiol system anti-sigma-R factor [Microthrixaceae bacterium]|nr:mycothiol system anti-sigma-R factor [Microthrixaceae bacterium]HNI35917.1 mycothiol system anti-sigma-R factor [Microthrixaceae bacterium]
MSENCDVALAELYEYLDGELTDEARARIERHLLECSPCLEAFDFEAEVRRIIADRCRDQCPDELRRRIQAAIDGNA